ncbi:MAG: hypothetical protein IJU23_09505, partial [Proteobacteria bacterium]|nr:hypothetical protein [Pseudomonadota bacterium]
QDNGQRPPQDNGQRPPQDNGQRPPQDNVQRPPQGHQDDRRPARPSDAEIAARATVGAVTAVAVTAMSLPIPKDDHYVFGMDIRGFGDVATGCKVGGGIGIDMWFRPIRWIAVELYSDFVLNTNKDLYVKEDSDDDMLLRMPIYLGARIHVFDYAAYNVYAAVAGGLNIQIIGDHDSEIGGGLQAGFGASYIIHGFNIGIDVRYTMESLNSRFDRKFMHGCIFALNIGFAR